jgi:hypothetical protein
MLKQKVAMKIFPDSLSTTSAMQLLRKEIRKAPELREKLYEEGISIYVHYFTYKQVTMILNHFGITQEEFEQL